MTAIDDFIPFPKISRLFRDIVVTEKIDGTNACVAIEEDGVTIRAASRTRWITPEADNFGFAKWVQANADELRKLGPGRHFGEWWGVGVQRGYGLKEKRFSLFNIAKWEDPQTRPVCCDVVPVLYRGAFVMPFITQAMIDLKNEGSHAAPGFMKPEGVVVFHTAGSVLFKATLEGDEKRKGE